MASSAEWRAEHAEHRAAEADRWAIENGFACAPLRRRKALLQQYGFANLQGYERWLLRRLGGEISAGPGKTGSPQISHYMQELKLVREEIQARSLETRRAIPEPPRPNRPSMRPGRPRDASKRALPTRLPKAA